MNPMDRQLRPGDAIRTNPQDGYWGLAVVLDLFAMERSTKEYVHIGITPVVRRHKFALEHVIADEIRILDFEKHYSPNPDLTLKKTVPSIYKYPNVHVSALEVIGYLSPCDVYSGPLSTHIGSDPGAFPLTPHIDRYLGNEAVITWRRVHDTEAWNAAVAKSRAEWFASEEKRLKDAREKAKQRRNRRT